jgi:ferrous iron transport protein A
MHPHRSGTMRLSEAQVGNSVMIQGVVSTDHGLEVRLEHVGFLPGTVVRVERRAPLGDPTVYELRGFRLALRRESADLIDVVDVDDDVTGENP